jgi:hypothetical protein
MFALPDSWVWDFWLADDGDRYHLFFLYASRALRDPDARHHRASIGHAVSDDLVTWERVEDALVRGDRPTFDDLATWTGSIVRHPDGTWYMFYTGSSLTADGLNVQSVGYATSTDLMTWQKAPENPVLRADATWYEKLADGTWREEAFRDPWVFADPDGDGWHMLVTARANAGAPDDRGVVGHAWSPDLRRWEPRPPLSAPGQGFGHLEVLQVEEVAGRAVLLFSCTAPDLSTARRSTGTTGGIWAAAGESVLGPFDIAGARLVTDETLYVGRLIRRRDDGAWQMLAFHNIDADGAFGGTITDPMAVAWRDGFFVADADAAVPGAQAS